MIVILGAGISGLSLSYFLSSNGIKNIVIDKKSDLGTRHRSTCLVSHRIFKYFNFLDRRLILKSFNVASFWYDNEKIFSVQSNKKMFLLDYLKLENEIFKNIDKEYSTFLFGEKVLDINLDKNYLLTDKRKMKFDIFVDASGTESFLANKLNLFKFKRIFNSFEVLASSRKKFNNVNIFFNKKFSKTKFGWYIDLDNEALIGLIDINLKIVRFKDFLRKFNITKICYLYSHPILFCKLKKLQLKNSIIVGEASGVLKPFSLGGIIYGIISSFIAYRLIKNNEIEKYEKIIKDVFYKSILLGKFVDKIVKYKNLMKIASFFKLNELAYLLDLDLMSKGI